jgi:pimeloyl-ACP methyl ester carboxylesterase
MSHRVRGDGPPLLLCAGTGYHGGTWPDWMVDPLAEHFSVVTFDYRGTGQTPGVPGEYTTRLFAADVARLIDQLGKGPAHVLGHSMGGRVAQWVALDHPDRLRSLVLAASGPGEHRPGVEPTTGIPPAAAAEMIERGYQDYMTYQINTTFFTPEYIAARPDVVRWLVDAYWTGRPDLRNYLKHVAARQGHRTADRLDGITQPTLIIVGDRDTHVGGTGSHVDQSRYLATRLRHNRYVEVPGAAHGYFWSHTDVSVAALVDFLHGVDQGQG